MTPKAEENRVRRRAMRLGLLLRKSRARAIHVDDLRGYQLVDAKRNRVKGGARFDWTLADVQAHLDDVEAALRAPTEPTFADELERARRTSPISERKWGRF